MQLICYPLMGTKTKRLMVKRTRKNGRKVGNTYHYVPRTDLIKRLTQELQMSEKAVRKQINEERLWLLRETWNDPTITRADV
jgi:hypothetical protein